MAKPPATQRRGLPGVLLRLASFAEGAWSRYVFGPLVATAPPTVLLTYYDVGLGPVTVLPEGWTEFLTQHQFWLLIGSAAWVYFFYVASGFLQRISQASDGMKDTELSALFETIDRVVEAKATRFLECAKRIASGEKLAPGNVFTEITKPDQQILLLAVGLHSFFGAIDVSDVRFKVTVADMDDDGKPVGWFCYQPLSDPPRTQIEVLREGNSAICRAAATRRLVIVEDFEKESKKGKSGAYVLANRETVEEGSLLCYPVYDPAMSKTKAVPYVITVVADRKRYFTRDKKALYEWMLKKFVVRLRLEHYLLVLKQHTGGGERANGNQTS